MELKKYEQKTIQQTIKLFQLRFKDKDILFEMKCGYFWTWCDRLESGKALNYADTETAKVLNQILND